MALNIGTLFENRYRILSILGQGGMGAVYRAQDERLGIQVAVKENLFLTVEYARQFEREAKTMALLKHPSLPRVIDFYSVDSQGQYMVMDYIEGEDLRQRIERAGSVSDRDVILIGSAICDALDYLHSRNPQVLHRDIKPGNIKITPQGTVVLVDFGLVKVIEENSQNTTTGARAMTPGYSPPEQYGTAHTDERSDIYSLGATLYAALTGTIPEDGLDRATGKVDLTPVRKLAPKVNKKLAAVIEKALQVEPDDRYQTAREFRRALLDAGELTHLLTEEIFVSPPPEEVSSDGASGEKPPSKPMVSNLPASRNRSSRSRRIRRRRLTAFAIIVSLLAVTASLIFLQPELPLALMSRFAPQPTPTQAPTATVPAPTATLMAAAATATPDPTIQSSATPTITRTPSPTPLGGSYGEIAFATNRSGIFQIWLMDSSGNNLRQITNMEKGACQPDWSPDGSKLAFISPCLQRSDKYPEASIYIINADGSGLQQMPGSSTAGDYDPDWSPDGKALAFTSLRTGKEHVFVIDLTSGKIEELSNTPQSEKNPAWDPSGKNIAVSRVSTSLQVWILPTNGQPAWQYSRSGNFDNYDPQWSADGLFIYYTQTKAGGGLPYLVKRFYEDREGSKEYRVPLPGPGLIAFPVRDVNLSPDGQWYVYESWPDGKNHDIFVMDHEGKNQVRLTKDPGFEFSPVWRPGGSQTP